MPDTNQESRSNRRRGRVFGSLTAALGLLAAANAETTWYVDDNTCPNEGSGTEVSPFCSIQRGIDEAQDGDTVLVLPGVYQETTISFLGKSITVRGRDGADATTIEKIGTSGSRTFAFSNNEGRSSVLERFTITTANAGGGIACSYASPTIRDNIIRDNKVTIGDDDGGGGGISLLSSGAKIERNVICNNEVNGSGTADSVGGGGILVQGTIPVETPLEILDCTIEGNRAVNEVSTDTGYGGGVFFYGVVGEAVISRSVIDHNYASGNGGGISQSVPIAMLGDEVTTTTACNACGGFLNLMVHDTLIFGNTSFGEGGGVAFIRCSKPTFKNCTFSGNYAVESAGGVLNFRSCMEICNSVLWDDMAGSNLGNEITLDGNGALVVSFSDVMGGYSGVYQPLPESIAWVNNIEPPENPAFCDADRFNFHVASDSPIVDAGDSDCQEGTTDLDGETRPFNSVPDMGAYENQGGNCSDNGVVLSCAPVCPEGTLTAIDPLHMTVDARQPNPVNSLTPAQGISVLEVTAPANVPTECFELCETKQLNGPNNIASITSDGTFYTITLARPITPNAVTTLTYRGDPGKVLKYFFHPANVNGDTLSAPTDILRILDCLNNVNPTANCPWGTYSEDIDQSGAFNPADILRVVDLLNGADAFEIWNNTPLPTVDCCPYVSNCELGPGAGTPIVRWVGPTGNPVAGTDYTVDSANPPNVVLKTTSVGGTRVTEWKVGCLLEGEPADLGSVTANWDSPKDQNIVVKVGTAETPVSNVGTIDIAAQGASYYSNLVLDVQGVVATLAKCYASGNNGGRISGTVGGPMGEIAAKAIGVGAGDAGSLDSESVLDKLTNVAIPAGSTLSASMVLDELDVSGDLNGHVSLGEIWYASGTGSPKGRLHVQGTSVSSGNISADFGLEGGKIDIDGSYGGVMTIHKMDIDTMDTPNTEPAIEIGGLLVSGGQINLDEALVGTLDILGTGTSAGDITIGGDLVGVLTITGSMSGNIVITGSLDGTLTIDGTFTGNVCASNIVPGEEWPVGLDIATFGTGATLCGAYYCTTTDQCKYSYDFDWCTMDECKENTCITHCDSQRVYGSVDQNFFVNLDDVMAVVAAYNSNYSNCAYGAKSSCDLWKSSIPSGCTPQDQVIHLDDIQRVIDAFGGNFNGCPQYCDCGGDSMMMGGSYSAADGPVDAAGQIIDYLATASGNDELDESGLWTLRDALAIYCQTSLDEDQRAEVVTIVEAAIETAASEMNTEILTSLLEALK